MAHGSTPGDLFYDVDSFLVGRQTLDGVEREPATYADPELRMPAQEAVQYAHSLGEIVTAAAGAGLAVERLDEHLEAEFDPRGLLTRGRDGRFRLPLGDAHFPVLHSLRAVRPR
ncbi:hypothetical protein ACWEQL_17425 [Kitasatospora sp. NPDC004240]